MDIEVRDDDTGPSRVGGGRLLDEASLPLVIATILREEGITGVHTHVRQLRRYLEECGTASHARHAVLVGPGAHLPRFRPPPLVLERCSRSARRRLVSALA